jgi:acetyl esterase/lipase
MTIDVRPPAPPIDPELAAAIPADLTPLTPENLAARQHQDATARPRPTLHQLQAGGRFHIQELHAQGVPLLVARPASVPAATRLPVLYYLHGGGRIMGNAYSVLPRLLAELAEPLQLAVISVEYGLAPHAQYLAPVEDCYTGLTWAAAHAPSLHLDPARIIIGGKSAGAGLAAGLALLTRDRGGPTPLAQLLLSPMLDDRNTTFSAHQMAGRDTWDRTSNATAWQAALGDRYNTADVSPYAAPARATDFANLPPTYLEVGSTETFRDETTAYANAIWQAGGEAELHVWPGAFHGFDTLAPKAAISLDARDARIRWLRRILHR